MAGRTDEDICNLALLYAGVNQRINDLDDTNDPTTQACNTAYTEKRRNLFSAFRWPFATKRKQLVPLSGVVYDATRAFAVSDLTQYGFNIYRSLLAANLAHQPDLDASAAWWVQVTRDGYAYVCPMPEDCMDPIGIWEKLSVSGFATPPLFLFDKDQSGANLRNPRSDDRAPFVIENANDGTDLNVLLTDLDTPILKYVSEVTNASAYPTEFVEVLAWQMAVPLATGLRNDDKKAAFCNGMAVKAEADAFVVSMRGQQEDQEPVSEFEAARGGAS